MATRKVLSADVFFFLRRRRRWALEESPLLNVRSSREYLDRRRIELMMRQIYEARKSILFLENCLCCLASICSPPRDSAATTTTMLPLLLPTTAPATRMLMDIHSVCKWSSSWHYNSIKCLVALRVARNVSTRELPFSCASLERRLSKAALPSWPPPPAPLATGQEGSSPQAQGSRAACEK